ncbi:HNH endonuclease, partial [Blautia wexlerae]|uniref:HNH endonuclease n=1 Tax=Blautia wexlerae TaxID=418240 RepID=UPI0034A2595A
MSVASIRDVERRSPYAASAQDVYGLCAAFDSFADGLNFEAAGEHSFDVPGLQTDQMIDLYNRQFVKSMRTRAMRDGIRNASPNGLCPYCGQGTVSQLDHYLPKASYSATTVHPPNLVPVCR